MRRNVNFCATWRELAEAQASPLKKLISVSPINTHLAEYVYETKEEHLGMLKNVHVILYCYVTAYARLGDKIFLMPLSHIISFSFPGMLQDMKRLMQLGSRLYYSDTG